jgi:hypothetical protein
MADISITAGNVVPGSGAEVDRNGIAGATITAGKVVYKDGATGKYLLADDDSATDSARRPTGIALNGASLNQPLAVQKSGLVTLGATLTPGLDYYLSDTAGGICPRADLVTPQTVVLIGLATSATVLDIDIKVPDVTL